MGPSFPGEKSSRQNSRGDFKGPAGTFSSGSGGSSGATGLARLQDRRARNLDGSSSAFKKKTAVQAPPATPATSATPEAKDASKKVKTAANRARAVGRSSVTQSSTSQPTTGTKKRKALSQSASAVASLLGS